MFEKYFSTKLKVNNDEYPYFILSAKVRISQFPEIPVDFIVDTDFRMDIDKVKEACFELRQRYSSFNVYDCVDLLQEYGCIMLNVHEFTRVRPKLSS